MLRGFLPIFPQKNAAMPVTWIWIVLGALALLVVGQQFRIIQIHSNAKKREELFQIVTENAADMIALVDVKGRRLYNSPAYKRILGYSAAELGETSAFEQIHPDDRFKVLEVAREARETGIGKRLEYRVKHKDGSWRVLESVASAVRDSSGAVAKLVIVNRDITERKRAEQQLEHNLYHDPLTGLPNRRLFLDRLEHSFARSRRDSAHHYALLLANVDHLKVFNETLGMAGGDHILQEIARRLAASLRQDDTIARSESGTPASAPVLSRLGGDEFTILLDAVGDPSDAMRVARRIQAVAAEPFSVDGREVRAAISIGIALATPEHERPDDILKDAADAMRRAKGMGGSRCEVSDEAMHARAEGRMRLEADLRAAIAERQFRVFYQPVIDLNTRRVVSLEALLRWDHPQQGLISPYRFIEAAEDTGILVSLGQWLLRQACRQLREWDVTNPSAQPVNLTVNVSARQFADARLASDLQDALRETGIASSRLQLEITESVAAADPKFTATMLSQLRQLGIGVLMDDYVGSSSLRSLWQFPLNALKIDRSLVREMQVDRAAAEIVETIIAVARKLNLKVIAEGVETVRQVEQLRQLGCGFGQGYYFSEPLEAKLALPFMRGPASGRTSGASA
jgi:diguanylate cyclase (GGDEF)-like protein/PAS domain S-box-containing protein